MEEKTVIVGDQKLSYEVIGQAMATHRELGPGLSEIVYHRLLSRKMLAAGIAHDFKPKEPLIHRGYVADVFECDLLVRERFIPELKVLQGSFVADHLTQTICYMKFWRVDTAVMFDFGKESLVFKRLRYESSEPPPVNFYEILGQIPSIADRRVASVLCGSLERIYSTYGLGYRDTTYRGLFIADCRADGVAHVDRPIVSIDHHGATLGDARLDCAVIAEHCALRILALRDGIRPADQAILRTCLEHLDLGWGLTVNFGKRALDVAFVTRALAKRR